MAAPDPNRGIVYKLVDRIVHGVPPTLVAALIVAVAVLLILALSTAAP